MHKKLEFRGLKKELIIEYLLKITNLAPSHIIPKADGSVTLKKSNVEIHITDGERFVASPILSFPRTYVIFIGDELRIQEIIKQLRTRTLRIGG